LTEASIADGMDMLEVGLGDMPDEEYEAHFSMWAALKSPLLIGADLRELSAQTLSILNNPAVIAVNQDPLGKSAHRISRNLNVPKDKYGQGGTQV
jgi:alpha-galactosidase